MGLHKTTWGVEEENSILYSNCPPLASTHARSCLHHSRTAESIIRWARSFQACTIRLRRSSTSRTFVLYTISCMHPTYRIIDAIQIWAVRRPQCRIYEVRSFKTFIRQKCSRFPSSVRWNTILLENVKLREFSNFRYRRSSMSKTSV